MNIIDGVFDCMGIIECAFYHMVIINGVCYYTDILEGVYFYIVPVQKLALWSNVIVNKFNSKIN